MNEDLYLSLGAQSLGHQARTLVRAYLNPATPPGC